VANFTLIRALGWALKSRLWNYEIQEIDTRITKTINAADGSSHAPSSQIVVHGSGMEITPLESTDADLDIGSGHAVDFLSGSELILRSGAALSARTGSTVGLYGATAVADGGAGGTNGTLYIGFAVLGDGHLIVTQYGDLTVQSGAAVAFDAGSAVSDRGTWTIGQDSAWSRSGASGHLATETFGDYSTLTFSGSGANGGQLIIAANGKLNLNLGATSTWANGSTITDNGAALTKTAGTWAFNGSSIISLAGTSKIAVGSTATIDFTSGAELTGTMLIPSSATFNLHADLNRQGADIPFGSTAYRAHRVELTLPAGGGSFTPTTSETYYLPTIPSGGSDIVLTLGTPSKPIDVYFYSRNVGDALALGHDYIIKANSGPTELARFRNFYYSPGVLGFRYTGSTWIVICAMADGAEYNNSTGGTGTFVWG